MLTCGLLAATALADTIEFGIADLHSAPLDTAWQLASLKDITAYHTQFVNSYNKRGGFVAITAFATNNCCLAVAGGKMITVKGHVEDVFPADRDGDMHCNPKDGYKEGEMLKFFGLPRLTAAAPIEARFACVAAHNPAIYYRMQEASRHCRVSPFSPWTACSRTCGEGEQQRKRAVLAQPQGVGHKCPPLAATQKCNVGPCPVPESAACAFAEWGAWTTCTVSCGHGYQRRHRTWKSHAAHGGAACAALNMQTRVCDSIPTQCPMDCRVTGWSDWSACTHKCGGGSRSRARGVIANAAYGGTACESLAHSETCNAQPCATDCALEAASPWTECSQPCGTGVTRPNIVTYPLDGGKACPVQRACNTQLCDVCKLASWTAWSTCLSPCGGGRQSRTRAVLQNGPSCGATIEFRACNEQACPVDCAVSDWGKWSACSRTCGKGASTRGRFVTRAANADGAKCPTLMMERKSCDSAACPVNCKVRWTSWGPCSASCGTGQHRRHRTYVAATNGGKPCLAGLPLKEQSQNCNEGSCATGGCKVAAWGSWSICSKSCGAGVRNRHRSVTQNANAVDDCPKLNDFEECNTDACPVDCEHGTWSGWSTCSTPCGGGTQERTRAETKAAANGGACAAPIESRACGAAPCVVNCKMNGWDAWEPCSAKCGGGTQSRYRTVAVQPQFGGALCPADTMAQTCNEDACQCPAFGGWSACTKECGGGSKTRSRTVTDHELWDKCPPSEVVLCNTQTCATDCQMGHWGPWGACSRTCGGGSQKRKRIPITKAAAGGTACGRWTDTRTCAPENCPVDCEVSAWTGWDACSATCGGGSQTRRRDEIVTAAFGGKACPVFFETAACHKQECPIDCKVSSFGQWGDCSELCNGQQERGRTVDREVAFGGKACPALSESKFCNTDCAVTCEVSSWGDYSPCTRTCGGGFTSRERHVTNAYRGRNCPALLQKKACSSQACPADCTYGAWTVWSSCSRDCGTGISTRSRSILSAATGNGRCFAQDKQESRDCNAHSCPVTCQVAAQAGGWGPCSKSCGAGTQARVKGILRASLNGAPPCPSLEDRTDTQVCNLGSCHVNVDVCKVSTWGPWSDCTEICGGGGTSTRSRFVEQSSDDSACPHLVDTRTCGRRPCPINCETTELHSWGLCSATCGGGFQTGHRSVLQAAHHGGTACPSLTEDRKCNTAACPQDCGVSAWGAWSSCSHTCDGGTRARTRTVTVRARLWGAPCPSLADTGSCFTAACPVDCKEKWGDWSACSATCGIGYRYRRMFTDFPAQNGGKGCAGRKATEICNAKPCAVDCVMSMWGEWGECSVTCAGGKTTRTRSTERKALYGGVACGVASQASSCNTDACPAVQCTYSGWDEWGPCSASGEQTRTRQITQQPKHGGAACEKLEQTRVCSIDCQIAAWSSWSTCTATCNAGQQSRTRGEKVSAQYGGVACAETRSETRTCNMGKCTARPCATSGWGAWGSCSASCGGGQQTRIRMWVDNTYSGGQPYKRDHVLACRQHPQDTPMEDSRSCMPAACPIDCITSKWSRWSQCSHTCGGGTQTRLRMRKALQKNGGKPCGAFSEEQACGTTTCPTDCAVTPWGSWAAVQAGGSKLRRTRKTATYESDGGKDCPELEQERAFSDICRATITYSKWSDCNKACGSGYRYRYREHHVCSKTAVLKYQLRFRQGERCNTQDCPSASEKIMLRGALLN